MATRFTLCLMLAAAAAAAVPVLPAGAQTAPSGSAPPEPGTGAEAVVNPDRGDAGDALERAATRPLRDLNIVKPRLDEELAAVMANPYDVRRLKGCRRLNGEVNRMTALVGPDVDDPGLVARTRSGQEPVEFLFDSAEGITGSLVPGQGIIRQLTGANKAARQVAAARLAGQLRRSYIKGIMNALNCRLRPAPAAPAQAAVAAKTKTKTKK